MAISAFALALTMVWVVWMTVLWRRKKKRRLNEELYALYSSFKSRENGHLPSIQEWEQVAQDSLVASRKRRGIKEDAG